MLCGTCQAWTIKETDLFCSWCGTELSDFQIRSGDPLRFYYDPASRDPQIQRIRLYNAGQTRLRLQLWDLPPWLTVDETNPQLEGRREIEIEVRLDPRETASYPSGSFTVGSPSGRSKKTVRVEVHGLPSLKLAPLELHRASTRETTLRLLECWVPISIERVEFDPPLLSVDLPHPLELEVNQDASHALPASVHLPADSRLGKASIRGRFHVVGLEAPLRADQELLVRESPILRASLETQGSGLPAILAGFPSELGLHIKNDGEENLEIQDIRCHQPDGIELEWLPGVARIAPRQDRRVALRLTLPSSTRLGPCRLAIEFTSNDPDPKRNRLTVSARVTDRPYRRLVAVDYGTTDSSVALLDARTHRPFNLELEPNESKIYSNILFTGFRRDRKPPFQYLIGQIAADRGANSPERFVKAVKTLIGTGRTVDIEFKDTEEDSFHELPVQQVAELILIDLLKRAQSKVPAQFTRFILCVPTRFTLRRKELLRKVLLNATRSLGFSIELDRIATVDESLAAGLFFLFERGPIEPIAPGKADYHMMVVDFGGGTTDVTVLSVRRSLDADGNVKRVDEVEIQGAWGDPALGGEGITREIAKLLTVRFLEKRLGRPPDSQDITPSRMMLEDEAEATKIAISELLRIKAQEHANNGSKPPAKEIFLNQGPGSPLWSNLGYLRYRRRNPDLEEIERSLSDYIDRHNASIVTVASDDFGGETVEISEHEVIEIYRKKLQRLHAELELLLEKIELEKVDVLLLAGQSSRFPTVREVLGKLAGDVRFVQDARGGLVLKECVSLGALIYGDLQAGDPHFRLTGADRFWTRLGQATHSFRGRVFQDWVEWGSRYPFESKSFLLTRQENVVGGRLILEIQENLSLLDEPEAEPFADFSIEVGGTRQESFDCQLRIDERGEVRAFCRINDEWAEMERE